MSKSISPQLRAHLAQAVTSMTTCWRIVRLDGATFGFTTLDQDLFIDDQIYQSTNGFSRSAIVSHVTGEIDNLDVIGFFSDTGIIEQDLRNGKFNYASVYLFAVNWADLSMGICRLRRGYLGECLRSSNGEFQAELRGLTQALVQEFSDVYSPLCRADLGDAKCKFPILTQARGGQVTGLVSQRQFQTTPLSYPGTELGNTATISFVNNVSAGTTLEISDGVATAPFSFIFDTLGSDAYGLVLAGLPGPLNVSVVGNPLTITLTNHAGAQGIIQKTGDIANGIRIADFTSSYLDGGTVTWTTGLNTGISMELKTYLVDGQQALLWLGMKYPIQVGDQYIYNPGCDKRRDTCQNKFSNILNFRGEPDMPGPDRMLQYPDAT